MVIGVNNYIRNNDINIKASNHTIHIEGSDDGLDRIKAGLTEVFKDKDVTVKFIQDGGLTVEMNESNC